MAMVMRPTARRVLRPARLLRAAPARSFADDAFLERSLSASNVRASMPGAAGSLAGARWPTDDRDVSAYGPSEPTNMCGPAFP